MKITKRNLLGALMLLTLFGVVFGMFVYRLGWLDSLITWIVVLALATLLTAGTYLLTDDR